MCLDLVKVRAIFCGNLFVSRCIFREGKVKWWNFWTKKRRKKHAQEPPPDPSRTIVLVFGAIALVVGTVILILIN